MDFLADVPETVCKVTPLMRRHPEIRAFYHPDPNFVRDVRMNFKIEPEVGEHCGECGMCERVTDEGTSVCFYCGV